MKYDFYVLKKSYGGILFGVDAVTVFLQLDICFRKKQKWQQKEGKERKSHDFTVLLRYKD